MTSLPNSVLVLCRTPSISHKSSPTGARSRLRVRPCNGREGRRPDLPKRLGPLEGEMTDAW